MQVSGGNMTVKASHLIAVLLMLIAVAGAFFLGSHYQKPAVPEVVQVPSTDVQTIREYIPQASKSEVRDISRHIEHVKEQAPAHHYYTYSQESADAKAQEIGKEQKADKVIKESREVEVHGGKPGDTFDNAPKVIENKYYGISLERKHRVKAGAAVINDEVYGSMSYQNRDLEYTVFASQSGKYGGGIQYTIAKW